MECKCKELAKLDKIPPRGMGSYALAHLEKFSDDEETGGIIWICPDTKIKFLEQFPHGEYQGWGEPKWTIINGDNES